jgi:hypothetical protein
MSYHDALKIMVQQIYVLLCSKMSSFQPLAKSPLAPSSQVLLDLGNPIEMKKKIGVIENLF